MQFTVTVFFGSDTQHGFRKINTDNISVAKNPQEFSDLPCASADIENRPAVDADMARNEAADKRRLA